MQVYFSHSYRDFALVIPKAPPSQSDALMMSRNTTAKAKGSGMPRLVATDPW
jgi:hypothetical protein